MPKPTLVLIAAWALAAGVAAAHDAPPEDRLARHSLESAAPWANAAVPTLADLEADQVNDAVLEIGGDRLEGAQPLALRIQILLDRAGVSPGVIDAFWGENVTKAVASYQEKNGLPKSGRLDDATVALLRDANSSPALISYKITQADVSGPFGDLPTDYAELAALKSLHYESALEMFGERFHMDTDLLAALNPDSTFRTGETILVADVGRAVEGKGTVTMLRADRRSGQLSAYDADGRMVTAYPATIGSQSTPSPSGDHKVSGIAFDPIYYYDPKNFAQGDNTKKLELPPGPNSPVGSVWIDLTAPTYGIHGTPEPSKVDKSYSHGCVRLTNWDAQELANLVKVGAVVSFVD